MSETQRLNDAVQPLLARARAGDADAVTALLEVCYRQIHRWALGQTGDPDDADDVTQEVLVRLHTRLDRYDGKSRFTTWLYRVTRNASAEHHRKRARRARRAARLELEPAREVPDRLATLGSTQLVAAIRDFFAGLPDRQREVFDLVDLQGMEPAEVSELLGMNRSTVRAHLFRARRTIRRRMLLRYPELAEDYT